MRLTASIAIAACACCVLTAVGVAQASTLGIGARARTFVSGLNTPTRAISVQQLAPSIKARVRTSPWAHYVGRARAQWVEDAFGTNCALAVIRESASRQVVRAEVEERRDGNHPCVGGQLGTRVVFVFGFDSSGHVTTLSLQNP